MRTEWQFFVDAELQDTIIDYIVRVVVNPTARFIDTLEISDSLKAELKTMEK